MQKTPTPLLLFVASILALSTATSDFKEIAKLAASDGAFMNHFGYSVAISGDTVAVGAYASDSGAGSVYVFERNQGGAYNWGEVKKLAASDAVSGDRLGDSVAISGNTLVGGHT